MHLCRYAPVAEIETARQAVNWQQCLVWQERRRQALSKTTSKQRVENKRRNEKPPAKSSRGGNTRISASRSLQAEGRRSTAASLLRSAPGWCGEDLEEIVRIVTETRPKARF